MRKEQLIYVRFASFVKIIVKKMQNQHFLIKTWLLHPGFSQYWCGVVSFSRAFGKHSG